MAGRQLIDPSVRGPSVGRALSTGMTPHQYIVRARLREAALRLAAERAPVLDIAFDCGFGDVSNFNRSFRAEFGISPRAYRRRAGGEARLEFSEYREAAHVSGP